MTRWNESLTEQLRTLAKTGLSGSLIAEKLDSQGVTREAVLGKLWRMYHKEGFVRADVRETKGFAAPTKKDRLSQRKKATRTELRAEMFSGDLAGPAGSTPLMTIENGFCRYPFEGKTGSAYFCCGEPAVKGRSYCPTHFKVCYQKEKPREHKI